MDVPRFQPEMTPSQPTITATAAQTHHDRPRNAENPRQTRSDEARWDLAPEARANPATIDPVHPLITTSANIRRSQSIPAVAADRPGERTIGQDTGRHPRQR